MIGKPVTKTLPHLRIPLGLGWNCPQNPHHSLSVGFILTNWFLDARGISFFLTFLRDLIQFFVTCVFEWIVKIQKHFLTKSTLTRRVFPENPVQYSCLLIIAGLQNCWAICVSEGKGRDHHPGNNNELKKCGSQECYTETWAHRMSNAKFLSAENVPVFCSYIVLSRKSERKLQM